MTTPTARQSSRLVSTSALSAGSVIRIRREEYLRAVQAARDAGDGERYADACLGVDVDSVLMGVTEEDGEATVRAAETLLRGRGVDPAKATYREFAAALIEISE